MYRLSLLTLCFCAIPGIAADVYTFSLLPSDGNINGAPGSTIGWGYQLQNQSTSDWLVTTGLNAGSFQNAAPDLIFDFPDLAPGATATVAFNAATSAGLYELTWSATAPLNFTNSGTFALSAQWWNGNSLSGGMFLNSATTATHSYAATAIPEPASIGLAGIVFLLVGAGLRARHRRP